MIKSKKMKDPNAGETETNTMQIKHTPYGAKVEPSKFNILDKVTTTEKVDMENIEIPKGVKLTVMHILGDDMYGLIGPENLKVRLSGTHLEKVKED